MENQLQIERDGHIIFLAINRPDKLNALDAQMLDDLARKCRDIERSDARVVILLGRGKAFSAGGDIAAWGAETATNFGRHWVRDGHLAFDALSRLRLPVIALLDGHALGGGLELAACADFRIAERQVKIGQPETGIGIIPGWSGTQRAVRRFGAQVVRRMAVIGEVFSAEEALAQGIVDHVVNTGEGLSKAVEIAKSVSSRGPRATELAKMIINVAEGEETERVVEALAGTIAAASDELREGLAAFSEKRKPDF